MAILLLAPHPFFQNRGTPIAVDLLIQSLIADGYTVDLLTYNEGDDRDYPGLKIHRVGTLFGLSEIRPGFSSKKLFLDFLMIFHVAKMLAQRRYSVIHAVEESVFIAMFFTLFSSTPFVYDMDSSLSTQLLDKYPRLKLFKTPLLWIESLPIRKARVVVPVCNALETLALKYRSKGVFLLKDISMLNKRPDEEISKGLREKMVDLNSFGDASDRTLLYVGNLESYQGIDLMLHGFREAINQLSNIKLIVIGGSDRDIAKYKELTRQLGIEKKTFFIGPKPIELLYFFCRQSDLLLSPRIKGENTPMKIYSYLDSRVPVLATNLTTHTEIVNDSIGYLAGPTPEVFGAEIVTIFENYETAKIKANNAEKYIANNHSYEAFNNRVKYIYAQIL